MSHGRNKYQSRENRARVRELFMREWDPIGVAGSAGGEGEYDPYVARAYVMLMDENATADEIADYLYWVTTAGMGMSESAERKERSEETARILVSMKPEFLTH